MHHNEIEGVTAIDKLNFYYKKYGKTMTNKDKIIQVAMTMFKNNGYNKTSIRDIVAASGISTGQFYKHFSDKDALLKEVHLREHLTELSQINTYVKTYHEPLLTFALNMDVIINKVQTYEVYAESIINQKSDFLLSNDFLTAIDEVNRISFQNYIQDMTDNDLRNYNILIQGMLKNVIMTYLKGYDSDIEDKRDLLIKSAFKIYDVPGKKIEALMALLKEIRLNPEYITLMAQTF